MTKSLSVGEAKASFTECVREVENGRSVVITRHCRAVAALVPVHEVEHLARLRAVGSQRGLASLAGGWDGSEELVRILESSVRHSPTSPLSWSVQ